MGKSNLSFPERFQLENILLWTDLCTAAIVGRFSALYINRSLTKNFSIETFLEMTDSSVKSPGKSNMMSKTG